MSEAFMIVDVQKIWAESNPRTVQAIENAAAVLRPRMPLVWVYMTEDDEGAPVQMPAFRMKEAFSKESFAGIFIPKGADGHLRCSLLPHPDDWVILKNRSNVFENRDADFFLRWQRIKNLLLAGFMTKDCMKKTVVGAISDGYGVDVIAGLTADAKDQCLKDPREAFAGTGARIFRPGDLGL